MRLLFVGLLACLLGSAALAQTAAPAKPVIGNPDWKRRPTGDEVAAAMERFGAVGAGGRATIRCTVRADGRLTGCSLLSEDPVGARLGEVALSLSDLFWMKPRTLDGRSVEGGTVQIPIVFAGGFKQIDASVWARTPTAAEVAAAYPAGATGAGDVVLECQLGRDGVPQRCSASQEKPERRGFERAAKGLASRFQMAADPGQLAKLSGAAVFIPIHFADPAGPPESNTVARPVWTRGLDPKQVARVFPAAAVSAGVDRGVGVVECGVADDGALTACRTVSEAPRGLGFGGAAVQVASIMAMKTWTQDGRPTVGKTVRLPIRFNLAQTPGEAPVATP